MTSEELEHEFKAACLKASHTSRKLPPDLMLMLYAYYKQATETEGRYIPSGEDDIRNAFKLNALLQVKGITPNKAKRKYIQLVQNYILD